MKVRILLFSFVLSLVVTSVGAVVNPTPPVTPTPDPTEIEATTKEYRESLREMSRKERRELKREQTKAVKQAIQDHKNSADSDINLLLLVIITILIPPLGVFLHQGEINSKFWLSLLLTILFFVPGLIYSLIVVLG